MRAKLSGLLIGALLLASCDPSTPVDTSGGGSTPIAKKLVRVSLSTQSATAGTNVSSAPTVRVTAADGVTPVQGVTVTFQVDTGGGQIADNSVESDVSGIATVGSWKLGDSLGVNRVIATAGTLDNSPMTFTATAKVGSPAKLVINASPTSPATAGQLLSSVTVEVQDLLGHTVTGTGTSITLSLVGPGTPVFTGTKTRSASTSTGIATFNDLRVYTAGSNFTLVASASGIIPASTNAFDVSPGAVKRLVWNTQPSTAVAGAAIPTMSVSLQDTMGNVVTGSSPQITLALVSPPAGTNLNGQLVRTASGGVASFPGITVNKPGTSYTLRATSPAAPVGTFDSDPFDIIVGAPSQLVLTGGPVSTGAGLTLANLTVDVKDALGNPVALSGLNVTASITPGTGTVGAILSGTRTLATDVTGRVIFNDLSIAKAGNAYSLTISAPGFVSQPTGLFNVTAGAATKAVFTTQPASTTAGVVMLPSTTVEIQDALGNTITSSSQSVSIAITGGTGNPAALLIGTVTRSAVSGVATFPGLKINEAGAAYTFTATAGGLTPAVSTAFDISPADPAQMVLTSSPVTTSSGATLNATTIGVQDAFGNTVVTAGIPVTIGITAGTGDPAAVLAGTKTKLTNASGTVVFNDLSILKAGTGYTLTATSAGMVGVTTPSFNVTPGIGSNLSITAGPASAASAVALSPSVVVQVQDANGNLVTTATDNITISIAAGTGTVGAILSGTVTKAAVGGVATFTDLSIDKSGTGYVLRAGGPSLLPGLGSAFNVLPGAPAVLAITTQPSNVELGSVMTPALVVEVRDVNGNVVPTSTDSVSVAVTVGSGTTVGVGVGGTSGKTPTNGIVTYSDLTFDKDGTGFTLSVTAPGLVTAVSSTFDITNANYVYFSRFNGASWDVWRMNPDGSNEVQVTFRAMASDPTPAKNPANGRVAFSDGGAGIQALYTMNGDGSTVQLLQTHSDAGEASWSPDGTTIVSRVSAGGPTFGLFTIKGDGSDRFQITGGIDDYPSWSPDGNRIAFIRKSISPATEPDTMMVVAATGGTADSLFVVIGSDSLRTTAWSPDGQRIATVVIIGGVRHILVISSLGGGGFFDASAVVPAAANDDSPSWSPDGTKIIFHSNRGGTTQVWSMNANGTNPQPMTATNTNFSPSWWN